MMTREALSSALEMLPVNDPDWRWDLPLTDIVAAARKQLSLMPEVCGTCGGSGTRPLPGTLEGHPPRTSSDLSGISASCPTCRGSGKVYPAELVERIATALLARWESATTYGGVADYREDAVAVLDALGETE